MLHLPVVCEPHGPGAHLRRMQLRVQREPLRHLFQSRRYRRLLLPRVCPAREGSGRVSQDCQSGQHQNRHVLREEKVRIQEALNKASQIVASRLSLSPSPVSRSVYRTTNHLPAWRDICSANKHEGFKMIGSEATTCSSRVPFCQWSERATPPRENRASWWELPILIANLLAFVN